MNVKEAGDRCDLTPRAIRLYEEKGLLTVQRDERGARVFDEVALADLAFIAKARSAGLSLADVRRLLRDRAKGKMAFRKAAAEVYGVQAARLEAASQALAALSSELTGDAHLAA